MSTWADVFVGVMGRLAGAPALSGAYSSANVSASPLPHAAPGEGEGAHDLHAKVGVQPTRRVGPGCYEVTVRVTVYARVDLDVDGDADQRMRECGAQAALVEAALNGSYLNGVLASPLIFRGGSSGGAARLSANGGYAEAPLDFRCLFVNSTSDAATLNDGTTPDGGQVPE